MKRVQEGETAQLALLFERHHLALFRYLLGLSGNRALSEDLVQDVFFRIIKYSRTYNPVLAFQVCQDLRYDEIGRILECEAGAVKVRVYRALKELRERFCELRGEKVYDV